jgi:uncharacterized protein (TIGR03437 family)
MKQKLIVAFAFLILAATAFGQSSTSTPVTLNTVPSRAVGQPALNAESGNPNLVEGREMWGPGSIAFDTSVSPPIVYISDTNNNRVLAWKNSAGFSNGQPADLVIGQTDKYSTAALGPGTQFSTLLNNPSGIAVSKAGDLYVADSGNDRVVRYPAPFAQNRDYPTTDLIIGQPNFTTKVVNYPNGTPSNTGLNLGFPAGLALDASGNLWVVDSGNRRVLEFPASSLTAGSSAPQAVVELGQLDFNSLQTNINASQMASQMIANQFDIPSQIAFDASGNLYVTDADSNANNFFNRVLVFTPSNGQFSNDQSAARIMGVIESSQTQNLTSTQITALVDQTYMYLPGGLFFLSDGSIGVTDTGYNRILIFPPMAQWPNANTTFSPQASQVIGQSGSFHNKYANANTSPTVLTPPVGANGFSNPFSAAILPSTGELFVVDSGNNRVVVLPPSTATPDTFGNATRVLGQDKMTMGQPNLIEGKEFDFFAETSSGGILLDAGIALDTTGSVPHLYVADPYNHRVLGFYDARKLQPNGFADIVIGEPDFNTALCNYPTGDPNQPTNSNLCYPRGVLTDPQGNLYVADTGNGRVLRFPAPFAGWPNKPVQEQADLVLGQQNFTTVIKDPSDRNMRAPYGLAFSGTNGLVVSDYGDSRVLYIPFSGNGTFQAGTDNGRAATKVFGQPDFVTITTGSATNKMNSPHHIACDTSGLIYVADTVNNRVLIFSDPNSSLTPQANANPALTLPNLSTPQGIYVNPSTGEVWVTSGSTAVRYPKYDTLQLNSASTGTVQAQSNTLALAQDQYGDLFVADASNRVAIYYQGLLAVNGASFYFNTYLAPGEFATVYPKIGTGAATVCGATSLPPWGNGAATQFNGQYPVPTTLGDMQVLFNGTLAPVYYASPTQINFLVPQNAPSTGPVNVIVQQASTGQVFGAGIAQMNPEAPAIFAGGLNCQGTSYNNTFYQAAVDNQDNTVNSQTNAAARGSIITIYATGSGQVNNPPADGALPLGVAPFSTTPLTPRVAIGSGYVDDSTEKPINGQWVLFSGLSPCCAGLWQIDVQIPMATAPGQTFLGIEYNNVPSADTNSPYHLYIWVK